MSIISLRLLSASTACLLFASFFALGLQASPDIPVKFCNYGYGDVQFALGSIGSEGTRSSGWFLLKENSCFNVNTGADRVYYLAAYLESQSNYMEISGAKTDFCAAKNKKLRYRYDSSNEDSIDPLDLEHCSGHREKISMTAINLPASGQVVEISPPAYTKEVIFKNLSHEILSFTYAYFEPVEDTWISVGWFPLGRGQSMTVDFGPEYAYEYYVYARSPVGSVWRGSGRSFCVSKTAFKYVEADRRPCYGTGESYASFHGNPKFAESSYGRSYYRFTP